MDQIRPKTLCLVWKRKFKHHSRIQHLPISLSTKFHLKEFYHNFDCLDYIYPKRIFLVQNMAIEHYHQIQHIWISLGAKFHLNQTILSFWTKFAQKWESQSKRENLNIIIECSIFQLVSVPNFILNNFDCLDHIWPKRVFQSEHRHWIWYVLRSLDAKFYLKQNLNFFYQIFPKRAEKVLFIINNPRFPKFFTNMKFT